MSSKQQGFTIVELMVYTTVLLGLLYVFTSVFTSILDVQMESETQSAIVQDSGYIFARMQYDMSRASSILVPASFGVVTNSLTIQINGQDYVYEIVNGNLLLHDPNGSAALNSEATTVSGLQVRRYGNESGKHSASISFTLTTVAQRAKGTQSQYFQTTVGLR